MSSEREMFVDPERYPALAALIVKGGGRDDQGDGTSVREPRRPKPAAPAVADALVVAP